MPQIRTNRLRNFWREFVLDLIINQFKQGVTSQKISLTVALGVTLGIFPIFGATTLLCLGFGLWLKLNQPVLQMVNYLVSALQLALILVFVHIGEFIVRAPPVHFSISEMLRKFHASPANFFREFGVAGLHGIIGWLLVAPGLAALLYLSLRPLLQRLAPGHKE